RLRTRLREQLAPRRIAAHHFGSLAEGQSFCTSQFGQSGLRAKQRRRPCQISQWLRRVHCSWGTSFIKSCSIFSGAFSFEKPSRSDNRATCVSTTTPTLMPNAFPKTTLAVFLPTPPSSVSCSMVRGTSPPWRSTSARQQDWMLLTLLRKKPVDLISCSSS